MPPISRDEAAQLLYNTVGADCVLWSNDKEEFVKDGTTSTGGIMDYTTVGEKYLDLQDKKGILTSVKYDDSEDAYTTKVDSIKESFDATTDYSDLMVRKSRFCTRLSRMNRFCSACMQLKKTRPSPLWLTTQMTLPTWQLVKP